MLKQIISPFFPFILLLWGDPNFSMRGSKGFLEDSESPSRDKWKRMGLFNAWQYTEHVSSVLSQSQSSHKSERQGQIVSSLQMPCFPTTILLFEFKSSFKICFKSRFAKRNMKNLLTSVIASTELHCNKWSWYEMTWQNQLEWTNQGASWELVRLHYFDFYQRSRTLIKLYELSRDLKKWIGSLLKSV